MFHSRNVRHSFLTKQTPLKLSRYPKSSHHLLTFLQQKKFGTILDFPSRARMNYDEPDISNKPKHFETYRDPEQREKDNILYISAWNINGLRAAVKKDSLQSYFKQYLPDILGLNETRIDANILAKESANLLNWIPEGHYSYFNCCKAKKGYAGTGLITKIKPKEVRFGFGLESDKEDQEGRIITAEFEGFSVVVSYTPNASTGLKRLGFRIRTWDSMYRDYVKELSKYKPVIAIGDFNVAHKEIDIYNSKGKEFSAGFTFEERDSFGKLLDEGFVDTFRYLYPKEKKYTWWSIKNGSREVNRGWRIDYCLVSGKSIHSVLDTSINEKITGSDHCPVEMLYKVEDRNQL